MTAATAVRERPILFSGEMVRAILDGRKTQTRRVLNLARGGWSVRLAESDGRADQPANLRQVACGCPHGQPGDRLWVRETFSKHVRLSDPHYLPADYPDEAMGAWYWADGNPEHGDWTKPKPSIHMPRWASRLTLEITDVRVGRLQEISGQDVVAEGVKCPTNHGHWHNDDYDAFLEEEERLAVEAYRGLWDSLNAKRGYGWDVNPFVWVIEFKRVEAAA